ncbi:MAG: hypothetical protein ACI9Y1_003389 [Lentisphaeria bacterium]|jgi:hypothetical protein
MMAVSTEVSVEAELETVTTLTPGLPVTATRESLRTEKDMGKGTLTYRSGAVFTGQFKQGKEHGYGEMIWPTGARYEGAYEDGKYNGFGTYFGLDGSRYEGGFLNGLDTGNGICYLDNDQQIEGACYKTGRARAR